jgi:methionyl aminopeptidase
MIRVKTPRQIEELAQAGQLVMECHAIAREMVKPGATTAEINEAVERHIDKAGARPAFKGYGGGGGAPPFPAACCMSPDEVVVHGFPSEEPLLEGQILAIDIGVELPSGWYGDAARTHMVGRVDDRAGELVESTVASLDAAIETMVPGNHLGDIGAAVQSVVEPRGFSVVRDLVGHGIGRALHEEPQVPNYGREGRGLKLREGMVLCVEPMINLGTWQVKVKEDGWTVVTADGEPSAHHEHMIAVTAEGPRVLTRDLD